VGYWAILNLPDLKIKIMAPYRINTDATERITPVGSLIGEPKTTDHISPAVKLKSFVKTTKFIHHLP